MKKIKIEEAYYKYICSVADTVPLLNAEIKKLKGIKEYSVVLASENRLPIFIVAKEYKVNGSFVEFYDENNVMVGAFLATSIDCIRVI